MGRDPGEGLMRELGGRAEALAGTMQRQLPAAVRGGGEGE
jgi:hypothetical protein